MAASTAEPRFLEAGRNCWRVEHAERVAFLVDGEDYFAALAAALEQAREQVFLIGWDFLSTFRLRRRAGEPGLADFLDTLVRRRRRLRVHVLEWDFATLYAIGREVLPTLRFGWRTHRRVRFALDGNHPLGACHHQKLVVVDDVIAFTGGFDIAPGRWDTPAHAPGDERRRDAGFDAPAPFHDVGVALTGPAARALGVLARERWRRATGRRVRAPAGRAPIWPEGLAAQLTDVEVAIARTQPAWDGAPECREVQTLYTDSIARARRSIYVENQYLTAAAVGEALCARLREPDGPEVLIVGRRDEDGWLELATMGALRVRFVKRLREADVHGRLAVVYPVVPGAERVNVHTKLMIVDDELVRLGSANLANRSMGLDTELDVAIEARGDERVRAAIAVLRDRLLAEHLGAPPERVRAEREGSGSLLKTLHALGGGARTLRPLEPERIAWEGWLPPGALVDPERPVGLDELSAALLPELPEDSQTRRALWRAAAAAAVLLALAGLWRFTPLADAITPEALARLGGALREAPLGALVASLSIALAGSLGVPITALIVASALVFGPWLGFAVAFSGALAAGGLGYGVGRALWRDAVRRLMTSRLRRLSLRIAGQGVLAVAAVRVVPVAPFAVVNLAAGASHVRLRDFLLGSALGMAPFMLAMTLLADRLGRAVREPGWWTALTAAGLAAAFALGVLLVRRRARGRGRAGTRGG